MNRSSSGLLFSKAIDGFVRFKVVEGLSDTTIVSYNDHLGRFLEYSGDTLLTDIDSSKVEGFFYWLRTDYIPRRITGNNKPLSPKTIYNYWVSHKSFFAWACRQDFVRKNPMDNIPRPRFTVKPINPLTKEEITHLLHACKYSRVAKTADRRPFKMLRQTYRRDKAIVLLLLDTGVRASELCALQVGDVDMTTGEVTVKHGIVGGAKGAKGRSVYVGKSVRRPLWRYLIERQDGDEFIAPLFITVDGKRLNRDSLRILLKRLGNKAGIRKCHPHKFRHTFAINYLRLRGDVLTLQALLGHSSLEMVKRYARIAKIDLQRSHAKSGPVDNWAL